MRLVPETWTAEMLDEHHALIKLLGQRVCTFTEPKCGVCPLLKVCRYGERQVAAGAEVEVGAARA
jgi:endonuclease-3